MKLHLPSILLTAGFFLGMATILSFQGVSNNIFNAGLTQAQKEVLALLSVENISDCQGGVGYKTLRVTGANLQVVNGLNGTMTSNGLGNVVIGYGETIAGCERDGSHNLMLGRFNSYSSNCGIVNGILNNIESPYSSILSGTENVATGTGSVVIGGQSNINQGTHAVICGGNTNTTFGEASVIGGGNLRTVSGQFDWRAGGLFQDN